MKEYKDSDVCFQYNFTRNANILWDMISLTVSHSILSTCSVHCSIFYLFLQFETHRQRLLSSSPENLEQVSFFVFHTLFSYVMVFDYYLLSLVADLFGLFKYVD